MKKMDTTFAKQMPEKRFGVNKENSSVLYEFFN